MVGVCKWPRSFYVFKKLNGRPKKKINSKTNNRTKDMGRQCKGITQEF